jgi:hypothetical protein
MPRTRGLPSKSWQVNCGWVIARQRIPKISPDWPWKKAFLTCWQRLCGLPAPA